MPNQKMKSDLHSEDLDFRHEEWYPHAKEKFSIVIDNRRRAMIGNLTKPRRIKSENDH